MDARSQQEEVKSGNLIFVPRNEDLRACVKAIQDDQQRRPAPRQESQPDQFDPWAAEQMYDKPSRVPQNLAPPLNSTDANSLIDAQPFEYQPDDLSGYSFELAETSRDDMYALARGNTASAAPTLITALAKCASPAHQTLG